MRVYPHGFSSHSVKDSHFLAMGLGGRRDLLVALGGEHHEKRPKNLPEGDTILYNAEGDAIRIFGKRYEIAWLVAWILFWLPMLVVAVVYLLWRELRRSLAR